MSAHTRKGIVDLFGKCVDGGRVELDTDGHQKRGVHNVVIFMYI